MAVLLVSPWKKKKGGGRIVICKTGVKGPWQYDGRLEAKYHRICRTKLGGKEEI